MPTTPTILIACIGNIFHGDDAFGVEVARALANKKLPENARVVDYGIRSFDLAFALVDGSDATIFVDAMPRGEAPGTVYVIEPDLAELENQPATTLDAHGMNPLRVLSLAKNLGAEFKRLLVVGCEPETLGDELDGAMGLSEPVRAAVGKAVEVVESLIGKILEEESEPPAVLTGGKGNAGK